MKKYGYKTKYGECICIDSLIGLQGLDDNSIDLVMTSPPFALQREKEYGNKSQSDYIDWFCQFAKIVYNKLKETGSFVVDLGGAYQKGEPAYSLYQFKLLINLCEEIGFELAQPFYWHNPSALPAPIEWVNKRKIRAKNSVNTVWWLCKNPKLCKADITKVLTPYSDRMLKLLEKPTEFIKQENTIRPSGHVLGMSSWTKDNGGAIPPNMLQIPNSESNSKYLKCCKEMNIKGHPARFPIALPEFFIKFLTEQNDLVVDIFGGSNTTGQAAEQLKRKWISFELSKDYVAASSFRFIENPKDLEYAYSNILNEQFIDLTDLIEVEQLLLLG